MSVLPGKDLRHTGRTQKLGWVLLVMLATALVLSVLLGIRSLGAA